MTLLGPRALFDCLPALELLVLEPVSRGVRRQVALEGFGDRFADARGELADPCGLVVLKVRQHLLELIDTNESLSHVWVLQHILSNRQVAGLDRLLLLIR